MSLQEVIDEVEDLWEKADYRSRLLIEDGREIPEEWRARSDGFAQAYAFCLMRLKSLKE